MARHLRIHRESEPAEPGSHGEGDQFADQPNFYSLTSRPQKWRYPRSNDPQEARGKWVVAALVVIFLLLLLVMLWPQTVTDM